MSSVVRKTVVALGIIGLLAAPSSTSFAGQAKKKPAKAAKAAGEHTMTGCLKKTGTSYTLTDVEGKGPKTVMVDEMAPSVKADAHVWHKVALTGTAVPGAKKG